MDSHIKSISKSMAWRIMGVIVLALVTYAYTRSFIQTGLITFIHHGAFLFIFYFHERAWMNIRIKLKSFAKTFTYEIILGNLVLGTITWMIIGSWKEVTAITLTYIGIKLIMYPINERFWNKKIVYIYLVADLFHIGHLEHIKNAKKLGYVVAGILTDKAAMEKKPKPIIPFKQRIEMISLVADKVIPQNTYSPLQNVKKLKPDILMETTDHTEMTANGYVESYGGKVIVTKVSSSQDRKQSSTKIKKKICKLSQ